MSSKKRLNWEKLLSTTRVSDVDVCRAVKPKKSQFADPRSPFERDYDQLIFSYPFRRLQDKTQVIPFPEFDFVHTRLTHSLEVASVGRSLGKMVSALIFDELSPAFLKKNQFCESDIGALVSAACLAHDIGNPPFGHSGEDSVSYYFKTENPDILFDNILKLNNSEKKMWNDLINFEGNANGFRIITKNCEKGINPTFALLGTFTKYPRESLLISDPYGRLPKKQKPKSQRKHGFFQEQRTLFLSVAKELGLLPIPNLHKDDIAFFRHPLAFLTEAADDISYLMIDFEDGCRLKLIDFDKKYPLLEATPREILIEIASIDNSFDESKLSNDFKESLSYLRSKVINVLTHLAFNAFKENYERIMSGEFDEGLVDCIQISQVQINLGKMKDLVENNLYSTPDVLQAEAAGFQVMSSLIDAFSVTSDICISCGDEEDARQKKLKSLLPLEFRPQTEASSGELTIEEKYNRLLNVLNFVTGMTDRYAVLLYRRIHGITLPNW